MNRSAATALMIGAACSVAAFSQQRFRYSDASGNILVLASEASMDDLGAKVSTLKLKGKVEITSASQGLRLEAPQVGATIATTGTNPKSQTRELRSATATGGLHVTKTVSNSKGKQTTDIVGSGGQLDAKPTGNVVSLKGPVSLKNIDERKRSTMSATGSACVANLEPGDKSKVTSGLVSATLSGPVSMNLIQAAEPGAAGEGRAVGTADRMEISRSGAGSTVRLIGHVEIHGSGASRIGRANGLSEAIFELNASGEVTRFQMKAGGPVLLASMNGDNPPDEDEGYAELQGARGIIRLKGYSSFSSDVETGVTRIEGGGKQVTVEDTGSGLTMKAVTMDCTLLRNAKGAAAVQKASLKGKAIVIFDGHLASGGGTERDTSIGGNRKDVIQSETMEYAREQLMSTLTFLNPVTWRNSASGFDAPPATYTQESLVEGQAGNFSFLMVSENPDQPAYQLNTGHLDGPVHFHSVRVVTPPATVKSAPTTTTYDVAGNTFDAKFGAADPTGVGTVTLVGNVKMVRTMNEITDSLTGTKAVVTMRSGTLMPARYQVFGMPMNAHLSDGVRKGGSK